ncbi:MAG: M15 family metallopeptidase [Tannerellaceae bacterium]|jgi:D-alanyl-D-alanine dipeptidase|nr:M15 family metallopeptidase [Tannerellaceae bacterium]
MKRILMPAMLALTLWGQPHAEGLDSYLSRRGLVDVSRIDASLLVELKYATPDNFLGKTVYEGIAGVWLRPEAALKLLEAQRILKEKHPGYSLIIYDAARPMSVQRAMWNMVKGTGKTNYVSNPANGGGLHNYGMAVDVGLADASGNTLPMGTPFDYFGEEAHTDKEYLLLEAGKISREALLNRRLLRDVMKQAGFRTILYEWWHFNACTRNEAILNYPLID